MRAMLDQELVCREIPSEKVVDFKTVVLIVVFPFCAFSEI